MPSTCNRAHQTPIEEVLGRPENSPSRRDFLRHCEQCEPCAAELARFRSRSQPAPGPLDSRTPLLAAAGLLLLVALIAGFWWATSGSGPAATSASIAQPTAPERPPEPEVVVAEATEDGLLMKTGQLLEIPADSVPEGGTVRLRIDLEVPSANLDPLPVKLRDTTGLAREITAAVEPDGRTTASLDLDAGWLVPGDYLIEVHTNEKAPIAFRRYPLRVR